MGQSKAVLPPRLLVVGGGELLAQHFHVTTIFLIINEYELAYMWPTLKKKKSNEVHLKISKTNIN